MSKLLLHYLSIGIGLGMLSYLLDDLDEFTNYDDIQINNNNNIINYKI